MLYLPQYLGKKRDIIFIACDTFAWYTSTDEVTNRLSASADFGNVFTEKFNPPTNWVPGQKVTKEVKVLNTGNIDSLVKVDIDGALTLKTVAAGSDATPGSSTAKYVTLTEDEAKAKQAGGFMIVKAGTAVATAADQKIEASTLQGTGANTGAYVFVRQIDDTTYSVDGYYYAGSGVYYAITPDGTVSSTTTNGTTTYAISAATVKLNEVTSSTPDLVCEI